MGFALLCTNAFPKTTFAASFVLNPTTNGRNPNKSSPGQVFTLPGSDNPRKYIQERTKELVKRQEFLQREVRRENKKPMNFDLVRQAEGIIPVSEIVKVGYERCHQIFSREVEGHNYFGIERSLEPDKAKAIMATWAWARRLDEIVDGINGHHSTPEDLDRWEQRLQDIFDGRPWDAYDAALCDTISKFPLDIMLFKDLINGTRMDMWKQRIKTFDQTFLYRYHISSSWYLMVAQIWGMAPESKSSLESFYTDMIDHGVGMSEADMIRDVAEDARIGRVYIPQDELARAGIREEDIYHGVLTDNWKKLMKSHVARARALINNGERGLLQFNSDGRWWLLSAALIYQQDLNAVAENDYDNLKKLQKPAILKYLWAVILAFGKSNGFIR